MNTLKYSKINVNLIVNFIEKTKNIIEGGDYDECNFANIYLDQ